MKKIYIFSAGPAGREIFDLVQNINKIKKVWKVVSYIDKSKVLQKRKLDGLKVIDPSKIEGNKKIYGICGLMNPNIRQKIYEKEILKKKFKIPNLIHPSVSLPGNFKMGKGNIIFNNVHISYDVRLKNFSLISSFSDIGHNTKAENYLTIMPSTVIGGNCVIGNNVLIGSNATILQNLKIEDKNLIGSNSLISKSTKKNHSYINFPRQIISKIKN